MEGGKIKSVGLYPDSVCCLYHRLPRFTCLKGLIGLGGVREKEPPPILIQRWSRSSRRLGGFAGEEMSVVLNSDLLN